MTNPDSDIGALSDTRPLQRFPVQLGLFLCLLIAAAIFVVGWVTTESQLSRDVRNARSQALAHVQHIRSSAVSLIISGDLASLEQILLDLTHSPNVSEILVTDQHGQVLSQATGGDESDPSPVYEQQKLPVPTKSAGIVEIGQDQILVWEPINHGGLLGWIQLRYSLREVRDQANGTAVKTTIIALVVLLACLLLLWSFLHRPMSMIRNATQFASVLDKHHGMTLPVLPAPIELQQLRHALNQASLALYDQDHRITTSTNALRESEEQLARLIEQAPDGIAILDLDGWIRRVNPAIEELAGRPAGDLLDRPFDETRTLAPESLARARETFARVVGGEDVVMVELDVVRPDGTVATVEVRPKLILHHDQPTGIQVMLRNITDRKQAEALNTRLGRVLDASTNELYVFNANDLHFEQVSAGAQGNLGYSMEELRSLTPLDLKPEFSRHQFDALLEPLRRGETENLEFETVHRRRDGSTYPVEVRLQLSRNENPPVFVAVIQDISQRKETHERLQYLANYDTLTGLPNRTLLHDKLDQALIEANRHQRLVAVMFIDLDNFKVVNDSLGHETGDDLLKAVARTLKETIRAGDAVARLGGDEFVVVLANVAHVDDISRVANKIVQRVGEAVKLRDRAIVVTPSIGITVYPFDDASGKDLLKNADTAMYHAKTRGRNNFQFYTKDLNIRAERRLAIEQGLREAVIRDQFELHFQPQVDAHDGRLTGAEALLRWRHPEWGMVPPLDFIPVAEEAGLIHSIGEWVLRTACQQVKAWQGRLPPGFRMAVNLSSRQFDKADLPSTIANVLIRTGADASQLDLEITESLLMKNLEEVSAALNKISATGVTISMDDFGTGYSSLSYLQRLPIDILKIDRSFVNDITTDSGDAAIARAIIALAHSLDIKVIAEGVETDAQLAFLRQHGCDAIQGYFIAKPMPAGEFMAWHASRHQSHVARQLSSN